MAWDIFTISSPAGTSYRIFEQAGKRSIDIAHIPMEWSGDGSSANLIAAAPDLLYALESLIESIDGLDLDEAPLGYYVAKKAIAKAKGEG